MDTVFTPLNPRQPAHGERGFSLIEVVIVVSILGILLAVAMPSFRGVIISSRLKSASFDVFSSISAARSDAITRNTNVTITPNSGTQWETGWKVLDAGGNVLKTQDPMTGITITGPAVTYNSAGRITAATRPTISLTAPDATADDGRCVTIDLSGRPVTAKGVCP